jgi:RNA-directed DNA polymerase
MADDEKAQLYKKIVSQSSDWQVLERMRVNGFWPSGEGLPPDPPVEAKDRASLLAKRDTLRKTALVINDPDEALAEERKRRWEESKKRRAENKAKRLSAEASQRALWSKFKKTTVVHAGEGVSAGLGDILSKPDVLAKHGLPVMHASSDVAAQLGLPLQRLRWLTYHRGGAALVHYNRYSTPKPELAKAQQWILENVLSKVPVEAQAHGFVPQRSIVTNATPHVGRGVVINLDLKDFFPTITFGRVKGLFKQLGYSEHVATVLGLLTTEPPRVAVEIDGKVLHVALGARQLPQGACTSPAITNVLCWRLDRRLQGLAEKQQLSYTRYADDLTFSGDDETRIARLLKSIRGVISAEGFVENPKKTHVMRRARQQEVTGVVVNDKLAVSREDVRALRATLHNVEKHGLVSQNSKGHPNFAAYLKGRVEFVCMVDKARAPALRAQLARALARG